MGDLKHIKSFNESEIIKLEEPEKINYSNVFSDYSEERKVCEYLGLKVEKGGWVQAYYGDLMNLNDNKITGWQVVCHISKLKMYLCGKINDEHYKHINK